jgi:hypothetical protein
MRRRLLLLIHPFVAMTILLGLPYQARAQHAADVVIEWNRILTTALAQPGAHPSNVSVTRPYAMVNVAMFDALNSIEPLYAPYAVAVAAAPGASPEAAAAQAAHDVAAALMPTQASAFAQALSATLAAIDPAAAAAGAAVGAAAARAILERRAQDSWNRGASAYRLAALPGYWQPTPPNHQNATFVRYQNVLGFVIPNGRSRMVEAPPALVSERYTADFNEIKAIGSANSTVRTEEQTRIARLWAGVGTRTTAFAAWNVAMQDVSRSLNLSALDAARMFAVAGMAAHDALIVSFTSKFRYGLWRPITAIREAARDNNPDTEADPDWTPLVVTPPNPAYPGNMACLGVAHARAIARIVGRDEVPVTITWTLTNGSEAARSYSGLRQIADELARSRQYAGLNFQFDTAPSLGACSDVADYAADNYLRAR